MFSQKSRRRIERSAGPSAARMSPDSQPLIQAFSVLRVALAAAALVLASPGAAFESLPAPPSGTIGVVRFPTLFGAGLCPRYDPVPVALYAERGDSASIGQIRVASSMTWPEEGGCSGLVVTSVSPGSEHQLPTREIDYESPAGIVLAKVGGWCELQLQGRTAWIHAECETGFSAVEDLLPGRILYLFDGALQSARDQPAGSPSAIGLPLSEAERVFAELMDVQTVDGTVWLRVAASHVSVCDTESEPGETQEFWIPLRDANGSLQLWYYSRGC